MCSRILCGLFFYNIASPHIIMLKRRTASAGFLPQIWDNRLEAACLRAVTYDNYAYKAISNILENKLDQQSTESFGVHRVKNIMDSAYIRDPKEYSSDMEANYA